MDGLITAVLPYLNAGGSISLIIMLRIAWGIYQKIVAIEKELTGFKVDMDNVKNRVDRLEDKVLDVV